MLPGNLSDSIRVYCQSASPDNLLERLSEKTEYLADFAKAALSDANWRNTHEGLAEKLIIQLEQAGNLSFAKAVEISHLATHILGQPEHQTQFILKCGNEERV